MGTPDNAALIWYLLPARDAHHTRLRSPSSMASVRAQRRASAQLLLQLGAIPSRQVLTAAGEMAVSINARQWNMASLAAGVRYFSASMRRVTGSPTARMLSDRMGATRWKNALCWVDSSLCALPGLSHDNAADRVACMGSEILLANVYPAAAVAERVRLRFPLEDLQFCMSSLSTTDPDACRRIARVVVDEVTGE